MAQRTLKGFFASRDEESCDDESQTMKAGEHEGSCDGGDGANESSNDCQCEGCSLNGLSPCQPMNVEESKRVYSHHSQDSERQKSYSRSLQTSWYKKYPWITVCTTKYKIFCYSCRLARQKGLLTFSRRQLNCFVEDGFSNWKKALEKLDEHERSDMHREAVVKQVACSSMIDVGAQLSSQLKADQKEHQVMLLKLLSSVRYLGCQGMALRGHHDSDSFNGNFYRLLLLRAEDIPELKPWLCQREYISPDVINEMIGLMGNTLLRDLLTLIRKSMWFSIIADEATDVSRNEQMSLCIRWADDSYEIHEEPLGLYQLPDTKAKTIFSIIKDVLIRCSLPVSQCIGQAYDGGANMSGVRNGVQALVKQEEGRVLYVHCLAHNLNLCVQRVSKQCVLVRDVMTFIYDLLQLIKFSPKRLTLFNSIRREVALYTGEIETPSLQSLCPTRWTVRNGAINSILVNYTNLLKILHEVEKGSDEYASKTSGLLQKMQSFNIFFGLKLSHLIFGASEQFSTNLQAKNTTVQEALRGSTLLVSHYKSLRTESKFDKFYANVLDLSSGLTEEPLLPRYSKRPRWLDEGDQPHRYPSPESKYRHAYFEILELTYGEIERRFDQADFQVIQSLESLLIKAANGEVVKPDASLMKYLERDIDEARFTAQLLMLTDLTKTPFPHTIKSVTNIRTIAEGMNQSEIYKKMLGEIDKALKIYLTFPVTTATAERSFSSLRRLKTYLRSTMTPSRLNNLFMLYVHSSSAEELDLKNIAREFISINSRRLHYFGKM